MKKKYCQNPVCEWEAMTSRSRGRKEIHLCQSCALAWDMALVEQPKIKATLAVHSGCCDAVNIPPSVIVEVRDYDVMDEEVAKKDRDGQRYILHTFEGGGQ